MDTAAGRTAGTGAGAEISGPYWDGAAEGRLVLQRCADCGKIRHYPRPLCDRCWSFAVEPFEASGRGVVHSWTVAHHAFDPALRGETPYVLVTVDLDEGVRALGRLAGDVAPSIGLDVHATFVPRPAEVPLLVFQPGEPANATG